MGGALLIDKSSCFMFLSAQCCSSACKSEIARDGGGAQILKAAQNLIFYQINKL